MSLTQTQIIQSLAEALNWFERELNWGVSAGELNHLTGRIGELYAAMITRGQMALETNQRGYDIISADNERVSVKTITSSNHVSFNANTFDLVDRVIVLRINIDDDTGIAVETLLDESVTAARQRMRESSSKFIYNVAQRTRPLKDLHELPVIDEAVYGDYRVRQYENSSIEVLLNDEIQPLSKPHLRDIAAEIGVDIFYGDEKPKNTRQLGKHIINQLHSLSAHERSQPVPKIENAILASKAPVASAFDHRKIAAEASYKGYTVRQLTDNVIVVLLDGTLQSQARPHLRKIAEELGIPLQYERGQGEKNTRFLGKQIISTLNDTQ